MAAWLSILGHARQPAWPDEEEQAMFPVRLSEIPAVQADPDIVGARHGRRGRNRLGETVQVRHLDRGDVEVMARLFDGLSAQGRYLRFLSTVPRFSARTLELLADADGINQVALVALRAEQPIGEARFVRSATDPGAELSAGSETVWIETTTSRSGLTSSRWATRWGRAVSLAR